MIAIDLNSRTIIQYIPEPWDQEVMRAGGDWYFGVYTQLVTQVEVGMEPTAALIALQVHAVWVKEMWRRSVPPEFVAETIGRYYCGYEDGSVFDLTRDAAPDAVVVQTNDDADLRTGASGLEDVEFA